MGGRVELKRIENKATRQASFSRRRCGLLKKAHELSVLCDVDVGLIIFSPKGKLYEFSSSNGMEKIIERYKRFSDADKSVKEVQQDVLWPVRLPADSGTRFEVLQILKRLINNSDITKLNLDELNQIEKELRSALAMTVTHKTLLMMDMMNSLQEKGKNSLMRCFWNQDQTENEGINEVANREGEQNENSSEVSINHFPVFNTINFWK